MYKIHLFNIFVKTALELMWPTLSKTVPNPNIVCLTSVHQKLLTKSDHSFGIFSHFYTCFYIYSGPIKYAKATRKCKKNHHNSFIRNIKTHYGMFTKGVSITITIYVCDERTHARRSINQYSPLTWSFFCARNLCTNWLKYIQFFEFCDLEIFYSHSRRCSEYADAVLKILDDDRKLRSCN